MRKIGIMSHCFGEQAGSLIAAWLSCAICRAGRIEFLFHAIQPPSSSAELAPAGDCGARGNSSDVLLLHRSGRLRYVLAPDRKSTRLNSSHLGISYAVFCLKKGKRVCVNLQSPLKPGDGVVFDAGHPEAEEQG